MRISPSSSSTRPVMAARSCSVRSVTTRVGLSSLMEVTMRVGSSAVWPCCSRVDRAFCIRMRSLPHSLHQTQFSSMGWNAPQAQYQPYSVIWGATFRSASLPTFCFRRRASSGGSALGTGRRTRLNCSSERDSPLANSALFSSTSTLPTEPLATYTASSWPNSSP